MESEAATGVPVNFYESSNIPKGEGRWSTDLCDCFSDIPLCCLTWWCPCITFGRIAEIVDKGNTSCGTAGALYGLLMALVGCQCIYSCTYRSKIKMQYGMESDGCADFCVHCWCEACALCQEYRELQNRGYDPALGWLGNMEKKNQGIGMAPPVAPGGMSR